MQYPRNATPLIVFGRPRAGTRFLVGALNKFPENAIHGELPNPVMKGLTEFVETTERYYAQVAAKRDERKKKEYRIWLEKKDQLIFSMWVNAGQARPVEVHDDCRYFGYKRPNHEFYFDFYEEHLRARKPVYIYCVRNFADNYLSISARWPERGIAQVAEEYLASIRQYKKIRQAAPDRVLMFILDEYIAHGMEHLEKSVLTRLDIDRKPEIMAAIAGMGPKNSAKHHKVERRDSMTEKEERFFARNPALRTEFESLLD